MPDAGGVTIFTLSSVSSVSVSAKPKSPAMKAYAVSWAVATVLSVPVGAVLKGVVETWKTGERAAIRFPSPDVSRWLEMTSPEITAQ